jgi:hypothetical protein
MALVPTVGNAVERYIAELTCWKHDAALWMRGRGIAIGRRAPQERKVNDYTLQDLEAARAELTRWDEAFANDSSNNPNKYESQREETRRKIRLIIGYLKMAGVVQKTEHELLCDKLDNAFPKARHKQIVNLDGRRFKRLFYPLETSRSGKTVKDWDRIWEPLPEQR